MEKINITDINQLNNFDKSNYFVMPYYDMSSMIYIEINQLTINWYNYNLKKISPYLKINKSLRDLYNNSKFPR